MRQDIMKRRVGRNSTVRIPLILKAVKRIEYFSSENNFEGGKFENGFTDKQLKHMTEDIMDGHAILFEKQDGTFQIRMDGLFRMEMTI